MMMSLGCGSPRHLHRRYRPLPRAHAGDEWRCAHITMDSDAGTLQPVKFIGGNAEPVVIARAVREGNYNGAAKAGDLLLDVAAGKVIMVDNASTSMAEFSASGATITGDLSVSQGITSFIVNADEGVFEDVTVADKLNVGAVTYPKARSTGQVPYTGGSGELYWKFADDLIKDDPIFKAHPSYGITQSDIDKGTLALTAVVLPLASAVSMAGMARSR